MPLWRYQQLPFLGKFPLRVVRLPPRRGPLQWLKGFALHEIFASNRYLPNGWVLCRIGPQRLNVIRLGGSTQVYTVHSPGGYNPLRAGCVSPSGVPGCLASAVSIPPAGTWGYSVKARHIEAGRFGALRGPRAKGFPVTVSHYQGIISSTGA